MYKSLPLFLITLSLLGNFGACAYAYQGYQYTQATPQKTQCKVIGVKDGDTIEVLIDGKPVVVRLANIDCPEKKQPFGNKAKWATSALVFGKMVTLVHYGKTDRYRRLIAEVILPNGLNVNKELVRRGLAWHFKKYSKDASYAQLEDAARQQKVGLWSQKDAVSPEQWRKMRKQRRREIRVERWLFRKR
ncbi:thermonuclease family protein [Riemerella columbipharyngis]|uniref:Endonuclease YncB, thermonuclease family n=1 Tax=Riemerella columbipharyngis TaxID=1071918 RepID=A0A1G7BBF2_9FLAO|nr:thermonuclease family protein [Riemerella columbipharyngis]SDE24130.1 Endonuclease YncB, thermonuclease family [Riemerella columbipharyngis]